jgi:hypothetical protein
MRVGREHSLAHARMPGNEDESMNAASLRKALWYYYGVLQLGHWLALLGVVAGDSERALRMVSQALTGAAARAMMISTYMDLWLSAPLGIAAVWGFSKNKWWHQAVLRISLGFAMASAFVYGYVLLAFQAWEWNAPNLGICVVFSPMVWLYVLEMAPRRVEGSVLSLQ